jgi:phosphohistidine phosphatase
MDILLIRHGQAVDEAPGLGDAGRWLTAKGRKVTRKVARWLVKSSKRRPVAIWTSPLVRAVQSAEILASQAGFKGELRASAQLGPGHDPGDLLKLLAGEKLDGPIALVGHEPSLSLIAHALLGDVGFRGLKKSGVLALTWEPDADAATPTVVQGELFASPGSGREGAGRDANHRDGAHGKLWFVLDPTRMKSRKTLDAPADEEPPTAASGA